ncbi:MAG: amidohydrolase family protein [Bacteroidota bacterium]|nr:amidohydrolase family protein [Bacteroidota bacterium]
MRYRTVLLLICFFQQAINGQEMSPINGVKQNFNPIYAFTNAHIIINPEKEIKRGTLLIQNKKIIQVDSLISIPEGAIIEDLNGDYIYPAFIDLYSEYGMPEVKKHKKSHRAGPQYKSNKGGPFHWNQSIHPEINASEIFKNNKSEITEYINSGFGSVLTHQKDGIFRGSGAFVLLSEKEENETILKSTAASFYSFQKGVSTQRYPTSLMGSIALIRQTLLDAQWYKQLENSNEVNISLDAFNKLNRLPQIFVINHVLDYNRVFKIGDEFEVDYIIKGTGREYEKINEIRKTDYPIIVPINFPEPFDVSNPEETEWLTLYELKNWETAEYNPLILANNNITFAITSSGIKNKKDFLTNLRKAIKKGLSKKDALAALTTVPSKLIKVHDLIGTLEKGKIANFLITSGDIFEDGIIYENWIAGAKNLITKKQVIDFRGFYTFNSSEITNASVEIKGDKKNPKIKFSAIDSSSLNSTITNNQILISTKNNSHRLIGFYNDSLIEGKYQKNNGDYISFIMTSDSLIKDKKKKLSSDAKTIMPEIWTPNKSYGVQGSPKLENTIFLNTTVWTNENSGILENTDVAIKDGKIIAIGKNLDTTTLFINTKFISIDATNKHLTCGIIDEHAHIAISKGVNESSEAVTAEVNIGDVINPDDINIYRQLAGGVTAVQLLHGSANPIGGQSAIIKLRWGNSAEEMKIKHADKFIKFALGENVKQSNWGDLNTTRFPQTRMGVEQIFFDAFHRAKDYENSWVKYNTLSFRERKLHSAPRENLELNILLEILNKKRFITCHSYVQSEINMLMHVADSMGFQVNTFTHILEGYKVAKKIKKHGAGASTFSDWWAYKFEVNDAIPYNASLLNNAGIITAINSDDAEMGRRLNQEAAKAMKYGGTSAEDAWKMITLNPAKLLHLEDRMGSIKIGKDADLVLWSEDPLSVYSKVEKTYVDGICLFDQKIDLNLRKRDLAERMRIIKKLNSEKTKNKKPPVKKLEKHYHCDTIEDDYEN